MNNDDSKVYETVESCAVVVKEFNFCIQQLLELPLARDDVDSHA